jgi:hypothetical protein
MPTYTIDSDKLTIGSLVALQEAGDNLAAQINVLRKIVVVTDGTIEDIPARHYRAIIKAVMQGVTGNDLGN